jgi:hypothetical protein
MNWWASRLVWCSGATPFGRRRGPLLSPRGGGQEWISGWRAWPVSSVFRNRSRAQSLEPSSWPTAVAGGGQRFCALSICAELGGASFWGKLPYFLASLFRRQRSPASGGLLDGVLLVDPVLFVGNCCRCWEQAQDDICGHFLSDCTCNLCNPSDLIIGHCGCDSDPWQWQITNERNTYRSGITNDHFMMLNASIFGFFTTIWMPTCTVNHLRRTRSQCLLKSKEMVLNSLKSGHYKLMYYQAADHSVFVFFGPIGCIRWRQLRESLMSFPRFGGEDFFDLSSVFRPQDLQLNPKPHSCVPLRLLVEPLALRLVRFQEAPGEDNCRFFLSEVSSDPLAGSNCVLPHRQCASSVLSLLSVCLVGLFISDSQSSSCMSYVVIVCYF